MTTMRMTVDQLDTLLDEEGTRYEIIDGELYVTHAPHNNHQRVSQRLSTILNNYSLATGAGEVLPTPGIIFDPKTASFPISSGQAQRGLPRWTMAQANYELPLIWSLR